MVNKKLKKMVNGGLIVVLFFFLKLILIFIFFFPDREREGARKKSTRGKQEGGTREEEQDGRDHPLAGQGREERRLSLDADTGTSTRRQHANRGLVHNHKDHSCDRAVDPLVVPNRPHPALPRHVDTRRAGHRR